MPALDSDSGSRSRPVALVTGGGVRVGRAIALALARSGYDLLVSYNSSPAGAAKVTSAARRMQRRAHAARADLSREHDVAELARTAAERYGRVDLLVNSAASFVAGDLLEVTAAEWDAVMAINLVAPLLLVRETADLLRASRGSVVNIVDLSALHPWPSHPHHSVSKAGLLHLTRVMARRLAPEVRVNAIAPGYVLPPEHHTEAEIERTRRRIPMGRVGTPEDVAAAVRFLARADYVTGQVVVVDGGLGPDSARGKSPGAGRS